MKLSSVLSSMFRIATTTVVWLSYCFQSVESSELFWTDPSGPSGNHTVNFANTDGSHSQAMARGIRDPRGMAVDAKRRRIYWTELGARGIRALELDTRGPIEFIVE